MQVRRYCSMNYLVMYFGIFVNLLTLFLASVALVSVLVWNCSGSMYRYCKLLNLCTLILQTVTCSCCSELRVLFFKRQGWRTRFFLSFSSLNCHEMSQTVDLWLSAHVIAESIVMLFIDMANITRRHCGGAGRSL